MRDDALAESADSGAEPTDVVAIIEEHRELFERLADSDLRFAKYAKNALEYADNHE
ncbi:hypothetical protein EFA46_015890 (plasmid) [Halarchaeum sp. CBA1220]|uniref:hypothetical protein n=1 Tax=Halarchaeum sp. CBA1220 TaxID=1853682 RepID=UPI001314E424|nr:hypothetical protein [Halarchaeum sp. CBA1220]QLC35739.1 hypothetical protein EFA46_015890 [Halarchaeum sp. CBA1220]